MSCGVNTGSQRRRQTRLAGDYVDYTYDAAGQLKTAMGKESGGAMNRLAERFGYVYDAGGNLQYRTNNALVQSFGVDNVNQLTTVSRSGKLTVAGGTTVAATSVTVKDNGNSAVAATLYGDKTFARLGVSLLDGNNTFTAVAQDSYGRGDTNAVTLNLPASVTYTYDDNGNLVTDGQRFFGYDDENQLITVIVTNGVNNSTLSRFAYDGFGRRRVRTECVWQNGGWATNALVRYVHDGMVVLQERDGNNLLTVTYTRGRDLSGSLQGAGGIGGLLSRTDQTTPTWSHAYYQADGNGNVTCLINEKQAVVARCVHEPFGNVLSMSGPLAEVNLYRFSSKEAHPVTGLVYYGFRFYDPNLQRWLNRDPIGENGGSNLHLYTGNSPNDSLDSWGLFILDDDGFPIVGSYGGLGAYLYDRETRDEFDRVMKNAVERAKDAALIACALIPAGRLAAAERPLLALGRFFYDPRKFKSLSTAYWRGRANGMHLHHWFFAQRARWVPEGIRNAGWNLLAIPGRWNSFMNGSGFFWSGATEWAWRLGIPISVGGAVAWPCFVTED